MKNIIRKIFLFAVLLITFNSTALAVVCDQEFEGTTLRFDSSYRFFDVWNNRSNNDVFLNDYTIRFIDNGSTNELNVSSYLDPGSAFDWTDSLHSNGYKVDANTSMRVIETGETFWRVKNHPNIRTNATKANHDFFIYYDIDYDFSNNYPDTSDDRSHVECQYFSVTWCGDGVLDSAYETCDPNDPNQIGWGNGGCNASCEPINVNPPATCDSISINPDSGTFPLSSNVTCSGTNANTYQIRCGNGQVINGQTGVCEYTTNSMYNVSCVVNGNITSPACEGQVDVTSPNPSIQIIKRDNNLNDIDGVIGNDTQTVSSGSGVIFSIRGINTGDENLVNVSITDPNESSCAGSLDFNTNRLGTNLVTFGGNGDHTNNVLEPGEFFDFNCSTNSVTTDGDNRANIRGVGENSRIAVTDTDDTVYLVQSTPNPPVCNNLEVNPTSGFAPLNSNVTCNATNATTFSINCGNGQTINGQTGVCSYPGVGVFTATCTIDGGISSPSCSQTVTVNNTLNPQIEVDKIDNNPADLDGNIGNDTQTINSGSGSLFTITVRNNGTEELRDIVLTDANAPACGGSLDFGTDRVGVNPVTYSGAGDHNDAILQVGEIVTYDCRRDNVTTDYINSITVEGVGVTSGQTVNDTDTSEVIIDNNPPVLSCDNLTASPTTISASSGDSTLTCSGTNANVFRIDCGNGQTINGQTGICSYVGEGTYNATCHVGDSGVADTTSASCTASVTLSTGGGGDSPICRAVESVQVGPTDIEVTCRGNDEVKTFKVDCGAGAPATPNIVGPATINGSETSFTATCRYTDAAAASVAQNQCFVSGNNVTDPNRVLSTNNACVAQNTGFCGDGILQTPNSDGFNEQCERVRNPDGSLGDFPSICTTSCRTDGGGCTGPNCNPPCQGSSCVITIPDQGDIILGPVKQLVVGHGVNPYEQYSTELESPYIENRSSYDIGFDELCVTRRAGSTADSVRLRRTGGDNLTICRELPQVLAPGQKVSFQYILENTPVSDTSDLTSDYFPDYITDKGFVSGSFEDNEIVTTIKNDTTIYNDAWFVAPLDIRVSKPSIATTGGGTSYVKNTSSTSNISDVAITDKDKNKNFVGAGVGGSGLSYTNDVTNTSSVNSVDSEGGDSSISGAIDSGVGVATSTSTDLNDFGGYNGIDNVYILSNKNFRHNNSLNFQNTGVSKTYIVENGDLYIDRDINTSDNIAFVVKNGDIIISSDVEKISGIFIVLGGGDIISAPSFRQLIVNGSLYGNTDNLIANRFYIKQNSSGQIDVGTIVSFGSSVFRKPAPLTGKFIGEYLESQKIAK